MYYYNGKRIDQVPVDGPPDLYGDSRQLGLFCKGNVIPVEICSNNYEERTTIHTIYKAAQLIDFFTSKELKGFCSISCYDMWQLFNKEKIVLQLARECND